jgi:hypothetical protein
VQAETRLVDAERRLARVGAMSFDEAAQKLEALKAFVTSCVVCGCELEMLHVMERARVGDLAEALLRVVNGTGSSGIHPKVA